MKRIAAVLFACVFGTAACAGPQSSSTISPLPNAVLPRAAAQFVYIEDLAVPPGAIDVYTTSGTLVRRVSQSIVNPVSMTVDVTGNLFVANAGTAPGSVVEFSPGGVKLIRTINRGVEGSPAMPVIGTDPAKNLYVLDGGLSAQGLLEKFRTTDTSPSKYTYKGLAVPIAMAIDRNGAIYVGNRGFVSPTSGGVAIFDSNLTVKSRIINGLTSGIYSVTVDAESTVYVTTGTVSNLSMLEFQKGSKTASVHFALPCCPYPIPVSDPTHPGFYYATSTGISWYPSGATAPTRTIHPPAGAVAARWMTTDNQGNLYVTWATTSVTSLVTKYAKGMGAPKTIAKGYYLNALATSP